jgi:hypothetical protein
LRVCSSLLRCLILRADICHRLSQRHTRRLRQARVLRPTSPSRRSLRPRAPHRSRPLPALLLPPSRPPRTSRQLPWPGRRRRPRHRHGHRRRWALQRRQQRATLALTSCRPATPRPASLAERGPAANVFLDTDSSTRGQSAMCTAFQAFHSV